MSDLDHVTARFGRAYARSKRADVWLRHSQRRLFEAFNEELENYTHARRSVIIPKGESAKKWVASHYPGWRITARDGDVAVLEEDPKLLPYSHVNPETGMVFARTTVTGSPSLDDQRLKEADPDLWERVTEWPESAFSLVRATCRHWAAMSWSEKSLDDVTDVILRENGVERVLRNFQDLSDADLALIQDYLIPGPVSVRVVPPRRAKDEELGNE